MTATRIAPAATVAVLTAAAQAFTAAAAIVGKLPTGKGRTAALENADGELNRALDRLAAHLGSATSLSELHAEPVAQSAPAPVAKPAAPVPAPAPKAATVACRGTCGKAYSPTAMLAGFVCPACSKAAPTARTMPAAAQTTKAPAAVAPKAAPVAPKAETPKAAPAAAQSAPAPKAVPPAAPKADKPAPKADGLAKHRALKAECKARGLATNGTTAELTARLAAHKAAPAPKAAAPKADKLAAMADLLGVRLADLKAAAETAGVKLS